MIRHVSHNILRLMQIHDLFLRRDKGLISIEWYASKKDKEYKYSGKRKLLIMPIFFL